MSKVTDVEMSAFSECFLLSFVGLLLSFSVFSKGVYIYFIVIFHALFNKKQKDERKNVPSSKRQMSF